MVDFKKLRDPEVRARIDETWRQREAEMEAREAQRGQMLEALHDCREQMTPWERSFLGSVTDRHTRGLPPTDAQAPVLKRLQARYVTPASDAPCGPRPG